MKNLRPGGAPEAYCNQAVTSTEEYYPVITLLLFTVTPNDSSLHKLTLIGEFMAKGQDAKTTSKKKAVKTLKENVFRRKIRKPSVSQLSRNRG